MISQNKDVVIYNKGASATKNRERRAGLALGTVSLKHALTMLVRGVAREFLWVEGEYVGPYRKVTAVELVNDLVTVMVRKTTGKVIYTKRNVLLRDGYRCAYCGLYGDTIDHVLPRSQGGETSWENCVAACFDCNQQKAARTPEQAGMPLLFSPYKPSASSPWLASSQKSYVLAV